MPANAYNMFHHTLLLLRGTIVLSICIRMHPYVATCNRHASACTHTPPYASVTHRDANIQHIFFAEQIDSHESANIAKPDLRLAPHNWSESDPI